MPAKKYIVKVTDTERQTLLKLTSRGEVLARVMKRAQILLKADEGMKDADIVSALNTSRPTVERIRKRFVEGNLEKGLYDDPRSGSKTKLDGRAEAQLIALACNDAPDGHEKWSLRMLADKLVELEIVEGLSHETVRQVLKKMT